MLWKTNSYVDYHSGTLSLPDSVEPIEHLLTTPKINAKTSKHNPNPKPSFRWLSWEAHCAAAQIKISTKHKTKQNSINHTNPIEFEFEFDVDNMDNMDPTTQFDIDLNFGGDNTYGSHNHTSDPFAPDIPPDFIFDFDSHQMQMQMPIGHPIDSNNSDIDHEDLSINPATPKPSANFSKRLSQELSTESPRRSKPFKHQSLITQHFQPQNQNPNPPFSTNNVTSDTQHYSHQLSESEPSESPRPPRQIRRRSRFPLFSVVDSPVYHRGNTPKHSPPSLNNNSDQSLNRITGLVWLSEHLLCVSSMRDSIIKVYDIRYLARASSSKIFGTDLGFQHYSAFFTWISGGPGVEPLFAFAATGEPIPQTYSDGVIKMIMDPLNCFLAILTRTGKVYIHIISHLDLNSRLFSQKSEYPIVFSSKIITDIEFIPLHTSQTLSKTPISHCLLSCLSNDGTLSIVSPVKDNHPTVSPTFPTLQLSPTTISISWPLVPSSTFLTSITSLPSPGQVVFSRISSGTRTHKNQ